MSVRAVNVGGGRKFSADGWLNLDRATRFVFNPDCTFPLASQAVELVYSSHALEHLDDGTVARVLGESFRVLKPCGELLIKIPDFDAVLAAYWRNDAEYFKLWPEWKMLRRTLPNKGMSYSLAVQAAAAFCGFWNKSFGHMFEGYNLDAPCAYYGPPVMTPMELTEVLALPSPHAIAAALRSRVVADEKDYHFNHQNAWGKEEFAELLASHGFALKDGDAARIITAHRNVPGIDAMRPISRYYVATVA